MAKTKTKLPVKKVAQKAIVRRPESETVRPFENLRREVDRLFEDFGRGFWPRPFDRPFFHAEPAWPKEFAWGATPAVDIVEKDKAYEVTAELPGLEEKNIEVKVVEGGLTIKAEKQEEKEEERKGYHLQERRFGSFERSFRLPKGVDVDKIDARFENGVLKVTLPKKPEARQPGKKIEVKGS